MNFKDKVGTFRVISSFTEEVEMANDSKIYQLLLIESLEDGMNDILFCQNVAHENIYITRSGED